MASVPQININLIVFCALFFLCNRTDHYLQPKEAQQRHTIFHKIVHHPFWIGAWPWELWPLTLDWHRFTIEISANAAIVFTSCMNVV